MVNVRDIGYEIGQGVYKLNRFLEDVDYVDLDKMAHIWSVGRKESTGEIFAATDARFYSTDSDYETLYLR